MDRKAVQEHLNTASPKAYLKVFWSAAKGASPGKRLQLLQAMNGLKPVRGWTKPDKRRVEMRKHFTFALVDFKPEAPCFVCGNAWHHRHHILNIQNGGGNNRKNIVPLCRKCHHQVHGRTF